MAEFKLKVEDFEQLLGALTTFDTTLAASCCQATIGLKETTMFNKWATGKSDLFTSAIHIDDGQEGRPDNITLFIPNVKKLIVVLKNIGKYYDIKDSTLFSSGKVKLMVCDKARQAQLIRP